MHFMLSTLMFEPKDLAKSVDFARACEIDLEIFPFWHMEPFAKFMKDYRNELKGIVGSFHEPYLFCEHSAKKGTKEHQAAIDGCRITFESALDLGATHLVFHPNNRAFKEVERAEMIKVSNENLQEMNEMAKEYGIPYLVENAGALDFKNMLLTEDEFIAQFEHIENDCLIDIGHALCNGWNVERVIIALHDKIKAYHLHSNDGIVDSHLRVGDGVFDIAQFKELYYKFTPEAHAIFEYVEGTDIDVEGLKADMKLLVD